MTRSLVVLLGLLWAAHGWAMPPMPPLAPEALAAQQARGKAPIVLDVRTPGEFAEGHIPGAVLIPYDEVDEHLDLIRGWQDQEIVVYCRSGRRSQIAEDHLRGLGITRIRQLDGSWLAWEERDLPVQKPDSEEQP